MKCFREKKERAWRVKARDLVRANKPEELRKLLSEDKAKKLIWKSSGKILSSCIRVAIAYNNRIECIELLLKAGADLGVVGACEPMHRIMRLGPRENIFAMFLEYGADPNLKSFDPYYNSPLCLAAYFAKPGYFRTLLLYGADPDYNCSDRKFLREFPNARSMLGVCLKEGYEAPFVKLLIDYGANMYLPDIQESLSSADNEAKAVLERERAHPRSLMSQCRLKIRILLRENGKIRAIDQLEIPNEIRKYLQYHTEMTGPEELPRHEKQCQRLITCR